jgi:hypothetical protein
MGLWGISSYSLSGGVTASFFLLYTAYDKNSKSLTSRNLVDLFLCRRGLDWTLVELNKTISLSGLSIFLISCLPQFSGEREDLVYIAVNMLVAHGIYSSYKFYQFDPYKVLQEKFIKKCSVLLGAVSLGALLFGYFNYISVPTVVLSVTTLSVSHFWTMEVDYKYRLQVRPYAYLVFPLAALALFKYFV